MTFDCVNEFESEYDSTLLRSSLINVIEDFSPFGSSRQEFILDPLSTQLFSPQQTSFSIPSPNTPFSISRPSPNPLSASPSSPFVQSTTTTQDVHNVKPPSISSTTSSSSSSSTSNPTNLSTEQTSKKSSFNRSLPKSLVS